MITADSTEDPVVSYLKLRWVIGVLGVLLPVALATWGLFLCGCLQDSISDYYGLRTRDLFVGTLFAIGLFLLTYRGYEPEDDWAGNAACLFAFGVALFPNSGESWEKIIHFASAVLLFGVLAYFSLTLFTKTGGSPTLEKLKRNKIYVACGWTMVGCIVLIGLYYVLLQTTPVAAIKPVFWLESIALWAFGFSWFVKGEAILKDQVSQAPSE